MAQTPRLLPSNFPQPLASHILKADAQRQVSMLRQEFAADLIGVLAEAHEPAVRSRLTRLIEANLKSGLRAAQKCQVLWPEAAAAKKTLGEETDLKPAQAKRFLKLFEQLDRVQNRSLSLLNDSFANVRLILDRVQPPPLPVAKPASPAPAQR